MLLELYNPGQARDAKGRWTKSGARAFLGANYAERTSTLQAKFAGTKINQHDINKMALLNGSSADPNKILVSKSFSPAKQAAIAAAFPDKQLEVVNATQYLKGKKATKDVKPKAPAGPKPAIPGTSELTVQKSLGGSTGAQLAVDAKGNKYVLKKGASAAHINEEFAAEQMYAALGVPVPVSKMDGNTKVSKFVEGGVELGKLTGPEREKALQQVQKGVAADALMANWDSVGLGGDNILVDKNGTAHRIDVGGSLRYRAQGSPKGAAFGDHPTELWTMREKNKSTLGGTNPDDLFGPQTDKILKNQAAVLAAAKDPALKKTMQARMNNMQAAATDYKALRASGMSPGQADEVIRARMMIAQKSGKSYLWAATGEPGAYKDKTSGSGDAKAAPLGPAVTKAKTATKSTTESVGTKPLTTAKSTPAAHVAQLKAHSDGVWSKLADDEKAAAKKYTGGFATYINRILRDCPKPKKEDCVTKPEDKKAVFALQRALEKAGKLPQPVVVRRGMGGTKYKAMDGSVLDVQAMAKLAETGGVVQLPGFFSTSTGGGFSGQTKFVIKAKRGLYLYGGKSHHPNEKELLLNHASKFKVMHVSQKGYGVEIHLEELD